MSSAVEKLQAQIDALRREAKGEGYAECLSDLEVFIANARSGHRPSPQKSNQDAATNGHDKSSTAHAKKRRAKKRTRRPGGENREMILNVLRTHDEAMGATAIQKHLASEGVAIAYSSTRHALDQLTDSGAITAYDGGLWAVARKN